MKIHSEHVKHACQGALRLCRIYSARLRLESVGAVFLTGKVAACNDGDLALEQCLRAICSLQRGRWLEKDLA